MNSASRTFETESVFPSSGYLRRTQRAAPLTSVSALHVSLLPPLRRLRLPRFADGASQRRPQTARRYLLYAYNDTAETTLNPHYFLYIRKPSYSRTCPVHDPTLTSSKNIGPSSRIVGEKHRQHHREDAEEENLFYPLRLLSSGIGIAILLQVRIKVFVVVSAVKAELQK